jgi:hypothetical protein
VGTGTSALALMPGGGLVVREFGNDGRVQFFATPDAIAMASMSAVRVAWMVAVARGTARRSERRGGMSTLTSSRPGHCSCVVV